MILNPRGATRYPTLMRVWRRSAAWTLRNRILAAFPPGTRATTTDILYETGVRSRPQILAALSRMERDNLVTKQHLGSAGWLWTFHPIENLRLPPLW